MAQGQPLLAEVVVTEVMTPRAVEMRRRRALARRMAEYDGVQYHDSMASSERVRFALEAEDQARSSA